MPNRARTITITPAACCPDTRAAALDALTAARCPTCGADHRPDNDDADDARASAEQALPAVAAVACLVPLREVIPDVALALLWRREEREGATLRAPRSPLASLQGRSSGASKDAGAGPTANFWRLVTEPGSKVGRDARRSFVDALVVHCEETSRPLDEDRDWTRARQLGGRLAALPREHRATVETLARRCGPDVLWDVACLVVAHELAPPAVRASWEKVYQRPTDAAGRPRVDRLAPPPEVVARAWGDHALRGAVAAWAASALAGT